MLWGKTYGYWLGILLLAALSYFVLFWQLGTATMREWDEAHNCTNAVDMVTGGNYLVRMYNGAPDFWETKPPLFTWLQIISVSILGYSEFAFRLPSALAALITIIVIVRFLYAETRSLLPGIAAAVVLLTNYNYTLHHCARSADHDALLILFEVCLVLSFYRYLLVDSLAAKNKHLLHCFIFFTIAVYTKSVAVLMLFPGLFIYALYQRKVVALLKQPKFYLYAAVSFFIIGLYYVVHEIQTPGYLQAVWQGELFPRYADADAAINKANVPLQYIADVSSKSIILFVFTPAVVFALVNKTHRKPAIYFLIIALAFYGLVSFGSYNSWYINPIIPLLAIVCGLGVQSAYEHIMDFAIKHSYRLVYINIVLFFIASIVLYQPIENQLNRQHVEDVDFRQGKGFGKLFSLVKEECPQIKKITVYHPGRHVQSIHFYTNLYNKIYGYSIDYCTTEKPLRQGDTIMCTTQVLKQIGPLYVFMPIRDFADCGLYTIASLK